MKKTKLAKFAAASLLAVSVDDHRLTWLEREFVRQLGTKLYGSRGAPHGGERHDPRT